MSKNRRERTRKLARRVAGNLLERKPTILIVCEGLKTEPSYLNGFVKSCKNRRVNIEIPQEQGAPITLVRIAKSFKKEANRKAKQEKDDNLKYDSVWCVFDIDNHVNIGSAKVMARDNGIELAISNPCFELWLLLHFRDNPGLIDRKDLPDLIKKHVSDYKKEVDYKLFSAGYEDAVKRAKQLDENADRAGEQGRNPSTAVYKLTKLIQDK